ncbi:MAG: hypothetical protein COA43_13955 [Robiginitomaculum sp.]|nr:MAG: hypothetical protein COA43_13955 [Robiginitomaculum sp.]
MTKTTKYTLTSIIALLSAITATPCLAQVEMESLQPAAVYDPGTQEPQAGGLTAQLWQGISAERATQVLQSISATPSSTTKTLLRSVLLTGGIPPQSTDTISHDLYTAARLQAILDLQEFSAFDYIVERANLDASNPAFIKIFTQKSLLNANTDKACEYSDMNTSERKAPYWAKLRAYCHVLRDELPAAELTSDLLERSNHKDKVFFTLLGNLTGSITKPPKTKSLKTPLHIAMAPQAFGDEKFDTKSLPPSLAVSVAKDTKQEDQSRLNALIRAAYILSTNDFIAIIQSFTADSAPNLDSLPKTWAPADWGHVYNALRASTDMEISATLSATLLTQADKLGILNPMAEILASDIAIIPSHLKAKANPVLFAKLAIRKNDIGALGALHQNLDTDNALRPRIALASDALGRGFMFAELGTDIETRLGAKDANTTDKARAIRDVYIANALGATLSDTAIDALLEATKLKGHAATAGQLLALQNAALNRQQAETLLRAADIIGKYNITGLRADTCAAILKALNDVGLSNIAGQLAAQDFLTKS